MNKWLILGLCLSPTAAVGLLLVIAVVECWRDDRDRASHIRQMGQATKVRVESPAEREQRERFESGAALMEAFACQLEEIRNLPEFDRLGSWTESE